MATRAGLALASVVVCATAASAQTTLGRLGGTVLDSSGAVLPGATITLTNENTNQVQTAVSGENGRTGSPRCRSAPTRSRLPSKASRPRASPNVSVAVGQEYSLTAQLALGAVSGVGRGHSRSVAGVDDVTRGHTRRSSRSRCSTLPLAGRDVTNLIRLQPGVAGISNRANTVINGGRPTWTTADARRHQHPGQFHPYQLARLPAEPANVRQRRGVLDHRRRCPAPTPPVARPRSAW